MSVPRKRFDYERSLLNAFRTGMVAGYGIEHTDVHNEERRAEERFIIESGFVYERAALADEAGGKGE